MAADFVGRFEGQRFVLDHLAKPEIARGESGLGAGSARARGLAERLLQLSGLVTEADWRSWDGRSDPAVSDVAFDCFGAGRLLIGSDWPRLHAGRRLRAHDGRGHELPRWLLGADRDRRGTGRQRAPFLEARQFVISGGLASRIPSAYVGG